MSRASNKASAADLKDYPVNEGLNAIRKYVLSNLDMEESTRTHKEHQYEQQRLSAQPKAYVLIKQKMQEVADQDKRLLVLTKSNWSPQPSAVVTIDKVYDRFAKGHITQRVGNTTETVDIPYTINYYMFLSADSKDIIEIED